MKYDQYLAFSIGLILLVSLRGEDWESIPLRPAEPQEGSLFTKISSERSGLDFINTYDDPEMWDSRYLEFNGGSVGTGITVGDLGLLLVGNGSGEFEPVAPLNSGIFIPGEARGLAMGDLNGDGRPDLVFTRVNDSVLPLVNQNSPDSNFLFVSFDARASLVAGSKVEAHYENGSISVAEVYCGGGYLSQSEQTLFFGYKNDNPPSVLKIRWSDGKVDEGPWNARSRIVAKPGSKFIGGRN